ncbi:hypothetical protein NIES4074_59150 [Cylindrospermum sp. NIES-4074]|nr:hypothetical protein NIES4074_59150 [Cylindrospermum sp. NIES-4074]
MKDYILCLAEYVYQEISKSQGKLKNRSVNGYSPGGSELLAMVMEMYSRSVRH